MKIAIVTDTHFGVRNDNRIIADHINSFFDKQFFPYIDTMGIDHIIHLGDVCDRRKYINFVTSSQLEEHLIKPIHNRGINTDMIIGNHDCFYKNTNEINSMRQLYGHSFYNFNCYWEKPVERDYDGMKVLLVPWICDENYEVTMKAIEETDAQILMGHFEIQGFEMYRGAINHHGLSKDIFGKFDMVLSGHFHHKSTHGNISYLGSPYQMTWSDYNDPRGFHILDTETRELKFISNPCYIFHKLWYDDTTMSVNDITDLTFEKELTNSYVKVIVKNKSNPYLFDLWMNKLIDMGCADIKTVEDHMNLDIVDEDNLIDEAEDTLTILHKYVDSLEIRNHKDKVDNTVKSLYQEAMNL